VSSRHEALHADRIEGSIAVGAMAELAMIPKLIPNVLHVQTVPSLNQAQN
jgi:hypothetical protein